MSRPPRARVHLLISLLLLLGFPAQATADKQVTVTVSAKVAGSTPLIIGYNSGHYYPGSNTTSWWRWAGVNGVRMFISPKTIEPKSKDDISGWGDGVSSQASFIARRKALRADPSNPKYINQAFFRSQFQNATLSGNIIRVAHALKELKGLGVTGLAMMGRTVSSFPFAQPNPWADRWEHWQYHYAAAYYLAAEFDLVRHQIYNEPNHSSNSNLSKTHYITRLRFASDAIQAAIADVNRDKKKSLTAQVQAPVTAGGGPGDFSSGGWGKLLLDNLHINVLGNKDPKYNIAQTYAYHTYNQTGPSAGSALAGVNNKVAKVMGGKQMPVAITEFNVHTNSHYQTIKETPDSPSKVARLGSIVCNLANNQARELYFFKFAQTSGTGGTVKKNGMHWVENKAKPYNIGGVTRGGAVVRLFAPAFKGARPLLSTPSVSGPGGADIRLSACRDKAGGRRHILSTNTASGTYLDVTLDLKAWGVSPGAMVQVQEVSAAAVAEVKALVPAPASLKVKLRQPPRSVWLVTVFDKAPGAKLSLKPAADSTVRAGSSSTKNHGADATLSVRNHSTSPGSRSAALLRFSLAGVAASDISMAVLELSGQNPGGSALATAHVYGLAGDAWQEGTITWSKAPNLKATTGAADQIQHNFVTGVGTTADIVGHLTAGPKMTTLRTDVTDFARAQSDGEASFLIAREVRFPGDMDDKGSLVFASRETKTGVPPRLLLYLKPGATLPKPDSGPGPADLGQPDAMALDQAAPDSKPALDKIPAPDDTARLDSGPTEPSDVDEGCTCSVRAGGNACPALLLLLCLLLVLRRRA